jgi:hypothetical protein
VLKSKRDLRWYVLVKAQRFEPINNQVARTKKTRWWKKNRHNFFSVSSFQFSRENEKLHLGSRLTSECNRTWLRLEYKLGSVTWYTAIKPFPSTYGFRQRSDNIPELSVSITQWGSFSLLFFLFLLHRLLFSRVQLKLAYKAIYTSNFSKMTPSITVKANVTSHIDYREPNYQFFRCKTFLQGRRGHGDREHDNNVKWTTPPIVKRKYYEIWYLISAEYLLH